MSLKFILFKFTAKPSTTLHDTIDQINQTPSWCEVPGDKVSNILLVPLLIIAACIKVGSRVILMYFRTYE
jgi:hypothetical protein